MMMDSAASIGSEFSVLASSLNGQTVQYQAVKSERLSAVAAAALFHGPSSLLHPGSGVSELMRAVLADAIYCFHLGRGRRQTRRLAQEAQAWFSSEDERWPFSFVNVCCALGLDPASVRRSLRRANEQPTTEAPKKKRIMAARRRPLHWAA
jgi:hypothetical protein